MPISILTDLVVTRVDLVDLGENQAADIVLFKRRQDAAPRPAKETTVSTPTTVDLSKIPEDQRPLVEAALKRAADAETAEELAKKTEDRAVAAEKERDDLKAQVEASKQTPEAVEKARLAALPEDIRKRLEANETEIAKMREEKETGEFVQKARTLPLSGATPEAFGPLLRRIARGCTTPEDADEVTRLVKSLGEQIGTSALFGERGVSGGSGPTDAYSEAKALAKAKVDAGQFPTIQKALGAVWREKPELWQRYRAEETNR
jgi:hypothetical protein